MNKTKIITDAASCAIQKCLDRYLELPGKAAELCLWFCEFTKNGDSVGYEAYSHPTYNSILVWMPKDFEVEVTHIYFDQNDELAIHGGVLLDVVNAGFVFDFWYTSEKMITKMDIFLDDYGHSHDNVKLDSSAVYSVLSRIKNSYAHLGLDSD